MSVTVTVNEQVAVFPETSVTRKVLVVVPTGKVAPLPKPAICAVVAPPQLSVPIGVVYVTVAEQAPKLAFTLILPGHVIAGKLLSPVMITSSCESAQAPLGNVQRNVVEPVLKPVTPEVGLFTLVIAPGPETKLHVPTPVAGELPASVAVVPQTD